MKNDKKEVKKNIPKTKKETKLDKKDRIARIIILSIVIVVTLILASLIGVGYMKGRNNTPEQGEVKIDDIIDSYGYELKENATTYYKELFNKLKILLATEDFNEEEYAKLIAQMFATDFYNLDDKFTNSDIGGINFVAEDIRVNFKLAAQNTMYNNVDSNIYGDRTQVLPKVAKTNVNSIEVVSYTYKGKADSKAYHVNLTVEYEEDLGYPKDINITLVHVNNKLEITKVW